MTKIILENFELEKIDLTNKEHLQLIRRFDNDYLVKKYLYPYKDSFYDLVTESFDSQTIFNSFYVINYENRAIGYVEIENMKDTYLNYALLKEERKKGLASKFLKELSKYLLENYKEFVNSVNTIIRNSNNDSIKASINSGFILTEDKDGFVTYSSKR